MFRRAFVTEGIKVIGTCGMGRKANTLCELIREPERKYRLGLGGVNGEFKIVVTRAGILSSDETVGKRH